jgi:hypothetical protein
MTNEESMLQKQMQHISRLIRDLSRATLTFFPLFFMLYAKYLSLDCHDILVFLDFRILKQGNWKYWEQIFLSFSRQKTSETADVVV